MVNNSPIFFRRIWIAVVGLLLLWGVLEVRLFMIQVSRHDYYVSQAEVQSSKKLNLPAVRGEIFDRTGHRLATNLIHYDIGADLNRLESRDKVATAMSRAVSGSKDFYLRKMKTDRDFVYLARKVSQQEGDRLDLKDRGLVKLENFRRAYPFKRYAGQLIGFTNIDDKGISGIEGQYDELLRGEPGYAMLMADARRNMGYNVDEPIHRPKKGADIYLTLDKNCQTIVEDELDEAVRAFNANYGVAVLMDPSTGEVLAMASSPGFDPNNPAAYGAGQQKNRVITDIFEPGSTFKIFPAAALLEEKLKDPETLVYCNNGSFKLDKHIIRDSKKYGYLTFRKVIENSSNIGMVKLTEDLDNGTLYRYLKNFGFDSYTSIGLNGEVGGKLSHPRDFSGVTKASLSFGYEIGVTTLQMANAYCAVVNGGNLMRPYVIRQVIDADGEIIEENKPEVIRQVISPSTAATLRAFMRGVVENGTGTKAKVDGVTTAGKTGTAKKYDFETRRYKGRYMSSFIGFAPYENPQYVLAVIIDEPQSRYYGGDVAAPVFADIINRLVHMVPDEESEPELLPMIAEKDSQVPDFLGMVFTSVEEVLVEKDIDYSIKGEGSFVIKQEMDEDEVVLTLGEVVVSGKKIPDMRGLTVREALGKIDFSRATVRIEGSGKVVKQSLRPGAEWSRNSTLILSCSE